MPRYRKNLPQLGDTVFLTDGGLETTLIFQDGLDLPHFASCELLRTGEGIDRLRGYYRRYAQMARDAELGFILESPTWRSNPDWAIRLGYTPRDVEYVNRTAIELMAEIREELEAPGSPMVISGCLGPRGDGYDPGTLMTAEEAQSYHAPQIVLFADTEADLVSAFTMTNVPEAIGITRAAQEARIPVAISFTLETDGRLPTGQPLGDAIEDVDGATQVAPAYYMINCAHPSHFEAILEEAAPWTARLRGLRANASKRSHAELDQSPDLDAGDPVEFGRHYRDIRSSLGNFTILGGCCGTDHRHVAEIRRWCQPVERAA